jgi:cell division protein FtsZ
VIFGAVVDENLKDEIFITVIATGFNSDDRAVVKQPQSTTLEANPKVLDLPTFMRERKKKTEETAESKPAAQTKSDGVTFDGEIDDLDIPTFLRKQMD